MENPFDSGYYTANELRTFGFSSVGENVSIAKDCIIIGLENISIGDNVRIDGGVTFAAKTGSLHIGNNVHVGGSCHVACAGGVRLSDFSGLSQGVKIFSVTDDYSGKSMTNPTVPEEYLNIKKGVVNLGRHVVVGTSSVILPGITISEGCSIGALSLVNKSLKSWGVYFGNPVKRIAERDKNLLNLEKDYLANRSKD